NLGEGVDVPAGRIGSSDLRGLIQGYLAAAQGAVLLGDYGSTGAQHLGELDRGAEEEVWIQLPHGDFYLVGVCDNECDDLDMWIWDAAGEEVDEDVLTDDVPVLQVSPKAPGRYRIRVKMITCTIEPCAYGFEVFRSTGDGAQDAQRLFQSQWRIRPL
ncbi:hypothetical protein ACFL0I_02940, partial [Gemmatimonadota bacterium]